MAFGTVRNKELIREIKKVRKKLNRNIKLLCRECGKDLSIAKESEVREAIVELENEVVTLEDSLQLLAEYYD